MESEFLTDKESNFPPVPLKTYQWEDLRRARETGGYPWTHFLKPPLEGEITAEDIIRDTTPRRSMSREFSKSRTHSPSDEEPQRILNLDSSPGSSRRHGEEGEDEGVHIPKFSKEISLDSEDDPLNSSSGTNIIKRPESQHLSTPIEIPKNISPKGILKRRAHEQQYNIGVTETREKTKCCHPLVNKIKYLADKTLHKLDKNDCEKSPLSKRKKNEDVQEIRQLKSSPGAVRRQKFSAIKLGDSDEMSKTISIDTTTLTKKEHIYEDIEESKQHIEKLAVLESDLNKESDNVIENKSLSSQDPSLVIEENLSNAPNENIMYKLHKNTDTEKTKKLLNETNIHDSNNENFTLEQLAENRPGNESPNITITEITDDSPENNIEQSKTIPIESSPSPSPRGYHQDLNKMETGDNEWSKTSSDHEYEIIEKPHPSIVYTAPSVEKKSKMVKTDEELSSTTSLERKYLQHTSDEDEHLDEKENDENIEDILNAETIQKNIEERFFVNTPSTVSRTECEISTSQVDSSALENLPLQRSNRPKKNDNVDKKIQQRIREGTGKLRSQAGKLKSKIQNMKTKSFTMPDRPKFNLPERPKFKLPARPKINLPERPKFTLPDRKKFSFTEKTKLKSQSANLPEKSSSGERKKFTFSHRPKFTVPDLSKIKIPERAKINFPSLTKKKEYKDDTTVTESSSDKLQNTASVDFEAKTYPRFFSKKKKTPLPKTSSSPSLHRDDTPPPTFTFTRVKNNKKDLAPNIPDSPEQPREYGNINNENSYENELEGKKQFETTYDFDKLSPEYLDDEVESSNLKEPRNATSIPDMSKQEYTHINEINNDEFFVRPRGISRENIQVREYLSDEIRQAFKIPKNVLATMGSNSEINNDEMYTFEPEADSELNMDDQDPIQYSTEDINDKDDGYYTFPPIRPSRAKRKKKETESIKYIDESVNASIQFSEVDLGLPDEQVDLQTDYQVHDENVAFYRPELTLPTDLQSIHEYANDDVVEYPDTSMPIQSQTLPMPPKRRKKFGKNDLKHSSLNDFKNIMPPDQCNNNQEEQDDIIVYRTEHEYVVPQVESTITEQSPVPPRRNRSRSSRGTSLCDDDRTSHGAESLTLDTHLLPASDIKIGREIRQESPGYATVDKVSYAPNRDIRRSKSKTPPVRRRKSNSSERKYHTVGPTKWPKPDRPPRKKSSTSLMTLDSFTKRSVSEDITQYVEIENPQFEEIHKDLISGEVVNKMKDRPLPPPPRPPRGPKRKKKFDEETLENISTDIIVPSGYLPRHTPESLKTDSVVEIEVSTQTDPLPDDVDFELGLDENLDISMSSSLRDIIDEESMLGRYRRKVSESPRISRATSRSEKSLKLSDPKISELSKSNIDRSSPTVILVEKRVSSPTKINEHEEMLTEATLTVQHIDIDESLVPAVPPLPKFKKASATTESRNLTSPSQEKALEKVSESSKDIQLDNLVTQRLHVKDLDVGRLNVSELQASKILVSDIEGMTLQVNELDSKSGHISVSGIEFSQSVIDEIVKKFAEISTNNTTAALSTQIDLDVPRTVSREEHTQTEDGLEVISTDFKTDEANIISGTQNKPPAPPPRPDSFDDISMPPQRPPPPDLSPLLLTYFQDLAIPTSTLYPRSNRERHFSDFREPQHQTPPPPARRAKRKPAAPHSSESSSDGGRLRPSPRRMHPVKPHEPTVTETGVQFLRACHNSITRTIRSIFNSFMSYIHGHEDKKDVQMALVIFLVLIAGLIMFGLSDSRTVHHHHWEFFNPPDGNQ